MKSFLKTKDGLLVTIIAAVVLLGSVGGVYVMAGDPPPPPPDNHIADHLVCYKVKDLDVHPDVQNLEVELLSEQFGLQDCKIAGNYREFCVPASKKIVGEDDGVESDLDGIGLFTPVVDRICYEIRNCKGDAPPDKVNVRDQFGQRDITLRQPNQKNSPAPFTLCTPAEKCNQVCVEEGEGTSCEPGGDMNFDMVEGICEDDCRCVQCGESGQLCCSGDECNGGLTCDAGTCKECGESGQQCCSGNTCDSGLTCDQSVCSNCGDDGQRCCSNDTCNSGLTCDDQGFCSDCGDDGERCCFNDKCNDQFLVCENDFCNPCGGFGEQCCPGDVCQEELVCAGDECESD